MRLSRNVDNVLFSFRTRLKKHVCGRNNLHAKIISNDKPVLIFPNYLTIKTAVQESNENTCISDFECLINPYLMCEIGQTLLRSRKFRRSFIAFIGYKSSLPKINGNLNVILLNFEVDWLNCKFAIDSAFCYVVLDVLNKRISLEECFAWLSTLGGGYSNLGQHKAEAAKEAGRIALKQMRLAYMVNDPILISRCWIFIGESLVQRGRWRRASRIVRKQYKFWQEHVGEMDSKLGQQCLSLWYKIKALKQNINPYDYS